MGIFNFLFGRSDTQKTNDKKRSQVNFTEYQVKNDIRILNDSLEILDNTNDINTFFSRWNLIQEKLKILKVAEQRGWAKGITVTANNISQRKEEAFCKILLRGSVKVILDIQKLKTIKGKVNKLGKYLQSLRQYENEYKSCGHNAYLDMIQAILDTKSDLENPREEIHNYKLVNISDLKKLPRSIVSVYQDIIERLKYSTDSRNKIPINQNEEFFLVKFILAMIKEKITDEEITLTRMSDGSLKVDCTTCYVGKINLQKNIGMQILRGKNGGKYLADITFEECIEQISAWVRYIKYCRKNM